MRRGMLEELNKSGLSVTDIANQSWCEYKVYLSGIEKEKTTRAMQRGTMVHKMLQKEVYKELSVEPVKYPDVFYKNAYENIMTLKSLLENGKGRELKIFGDIDGFVVRGIVDELVIEDGNVVVVENKTTEAESHKELRRRPHIVQVMLYKMLIDEIISKRYTFRKYYDSNNVGDMRLSPAFAEGLKSIGIKEEMMNIGAICSNMFDAFYALPKISDSLIVKYMNPEGSEVTEEIRIKYNAEELRKTLANDLLFWDKKRAPLPVPKEESWKCERCWFLKIKKCNFGLSYF